MLVVLGLLALSTHAGLRTKLLDNTLVSKPTGLEAVSQDILTSIPRVRPDGTLTTDRLPKLQFANAWQSAMPYFVGLALPIAIPFVIAALVALNCWGFCCCRCVFNQCGSRQATNSYSQKHIRSTQWQLVLILLGLIILFGLSVSAHVQMSKGFAETLDATENLIDFALTFQSLFSTFSSGLQDSLNGVEFLYQSTGMPDPAIVASDQVCLSGLAISGDLAANLTIRSAQFNTLFVDANRIPQEITMIRNTPVVPNTPANVPYTNLQLTLNNLDNALQAASVNASLWNNSLSAVQSTATSSYTAGVATCTGTASLDTAPLELAVAGFESTVAPAKGVLPQLLTDVSAAPPTDSARTARLQTNLDLLNETFYAYHTQPALLFGLDSSLAALATILSAVVTSDLQSQLAQLDSDISSFPAPLSTFQAQLNTFASALSSGNIWILPGVTNAYGGAQSGGLVGQANALLTYINQLRSKCEQYEPEVTQLADILGSLDCLDATATHLQACNSSFFTISSATLAEFIPADPVLTTVRNSIIRLSPTVPTLRAMSVRLTNLTSSLTQLATLLGPITNLSSTTAAWAPNPALTTLLGDASDAMTQIYAQYPPALSATHLGSLSVALQALQPKAHQLAAALPSLTAPASNVLTSLNAYRRVIANLTSPILPDLYAAVNSALAELQSGAYASQGFSAPTTQAVQSAINALSNTLTARPNITTFQSDMDGLNTGMNQTHDPCAQYSSTLNTALPVIELADGGNVAASLIKANSAVSAAQAAFPASPPGTFTASSAAAAHFPALQQFVLPASTATLNPSDVPAVSNFLPVQYQIDGETSLTQMALLSNALWTALPDPNAYLTEYGRAAASATVLVANLSDFSTTWQATQTRWAFEMSGWDSARLVFTMLMLTIPIVALIIVLIASFKKKGCPAMVMALSFFGFAAFFYAMCGVYIPFALVLGDNCARADESLSVQLQSVFLMNHTSLPPVFNITADLDAGSLIRYAMCEGPLPPFLAFFNDPEVYFAKGGFNFTQAFAPPSGPSPLALPLTPLFVSTVTSLGNDQAAMISAVNKFAQQLTCDITLANIQPVISALCGTVGGSVALATVLAFLFATCLLPAIVIGAKGHKRFNPSNLDYEAVSDNGADKKKTEDVKRKYQIPEGGERQRAAQGRGRGQTEDFDDEDDEFEGRRAQPQRGGGGQPMRQPARHHDDSPSNSDDDYSGSDSEGSGSDSEKG